MPARSGALIMVMPRLPLIYYPDSLFCQNLAVLLLSALAKCCGVRVVTSRTLLLFLLLFIFMILYIFHIIFNCLGL